jgi:aspartyl/asparaginyl-tRNA synthetase
MSDPALLKQKAEVFNLPVDDYDPYLTTRSFSNYAPSAGFGLGVAATHTMAFAAAHYLGSRAHPAWT